MKPSIVIVLVVNVENAMIYTVVVAAKLIRTTGVVAQRPLLAVLVCAEKIKDPKGPGVAEVVLIPASYEVSTVPEAELNLSTPITSQSPAVKLMLVAFIVAPVDMEVPVVVLVTYSPTLPAFALLLVVVPTMPLVCEGVKLPLEASAVKLPARPPPVTAEFTIAVVAICVVFVVAEAVGAAGTPVKVGEANKA